MQNLQLITYSIVVQDRDNVDNCIRSILEQDHKNSIIQIYDKPAAPYLWDNESVRTKIQSFVNWNFQPGSGSYWVDMQTMLLSCPRDFILFIKDSVRLTRPDVVSNALSLLLNDKELSLVHHGGQIDFVLARVRHLREVSGFDTKYTVPTIYPWYEVFAKLKNRGYKIRDVSSANGINEIPYNGEDIPTKEDTERYEAKRAHPLYGKDVIYIDGALGDHIQCIPLVRVSEDSYVCCKYPQAFNGINTIKGFVAPDNELFGKGGFGVYEFGHKQNIPSIKEAYCTMYNRPYRPENFFFDVEESKRASVAAALPIDKKIVVIAPFASEANGKFSNKNWPEIRWFILIDWLKKLGFYVIQLGSINDHQLPNADSHFLDREIGEVAALLDLCSFWIGADSFPHHMASAVKKRGICITPFYNNHAYHEGNVYLTKDIGKNYSDRRWGIDAQQPERKESVEALSIDDVKNAIIDFVGMESLIRPVTNEWLVDARAMAMQVPLEIESLQKRLLRELPKVVVEIGTARGGTLSRWMNIPSVEFLCSLDLFSGVHGGIGEEARKMVVENTKQECYRLGIEFHDASGDSKDKNMKAQVLDVLKGRKVDFLFIDADHTYDGIKNDYLIWNDTVAECGTIGFHDILESEWHWSNGAYVDFVWRKMKYFFEYQEWIDREGSCVVHPHSAPYGFGGIGAIKYERNRHEKFVEKLDKPMTTSICIGAYNNKDLTKDCLDSIIESLHHNLRVTVVEIFVHDNGSSDGTKEMLEEYASRCPVVKPIFTPKAIGYARAINRCVEDSTGNYIVLLNNDTKVWNNWLEQMIVPMYDDLRIGTSGPLKSEPQNYTEVGITTIGFVLGLCQVVRRDIFEELGMLDVSWFFGYHEDQELSHRISNSGYKLHGVHDASKPYEFTFPIAHRGSSTFQNLPNISDIQSKNHQKWLHYISWHDKFFVIIPDSAEFLINKVISLVNEDENCLICAVIPDKALYEDLFARAPEDVLYCPHLHIVPTFLSKKDTQTYRDIGRKFFGSIDSNIFYIVDEHTKNKVDLTWLAKWDDDSSMGVLSQKMLENMPAHVDTEVQNIIGEANTRSPLVKHLIERSSTRDKKNIGVMFSYPDQHGLLKDYRKKIIYTGADTDGGIPNFALNANNADILFTPSKLSRMYMRQLQVRKPIFVVPHGVDTEVFKYMDRSCGDKAVKHTPFTFLYVGECSDRKGVFQLVDAFKKSFGENGNVRLKLMGNPHMNFYGGQSLKDAIGDSSNILLMQEGYTQEQIASEMTQANCYVYPSRADTFGMTVLEAMSSGLPVIANGGLGVSEHINGRYIEIKTTKAQVSHPWFLGKWMQSDVNDLVDKMKDVYENYEAHLEKTEENSKFIQDNFNWKKITNDFVNNTLSVVASNVPKKRITIIISSFNRPDYLKQALDSLIERRDYEESIEYEYDIHVVENSDDFIRHVHIPMVYKSFKNVTVHVPPTNLGQRGAVLYLLDKGVFEKSDYIVLSDQDNLFHQDLSIYTKVLDKYPECSIATGYVSKDHALCDIVVDSEYGALLRKNGARAGHMVFRKQDFMAMMPFHLCWEWSKMGDSQWAVNLDWSLTNWMKNSPGATGKSKFVYSIPTGVEHIGYVSTWNNSDESEIQKGEVPQSTQSWMTKQQVVYPILDRHVFGEYK